MHHGRLSKSKKRQQPEALPPEGRPSRRRLKTCSAPSSQAVAILPQQYSLHDEDDENNRRWQKKIGFHAEFSIYACHNTVNNYV